MFECFMTMLFYRWPHWTHWQCFPCDWREQTVAFNAWGERSSHSSLGIQSQSIDERYTDYRRRKRTLSKGKFYFSQGLVHFDNERRQQQQQKIMKILQTFTKINPIVILLKDLLLPFTVFENHLICLIQNEYLFCLKHLNFLRDKNGKKILTLIFARKYYV